MFGAPPAPPIHFLGRDDAIHDVKVRLGATSGSDEGITQVVITLRGWPGVGKTAFAAALANDRDLLASYPDGVLWTSLGERPNIQSEIARWGSALDTEELWRCSTLKDSVAELTTLLHGKRMVLIVDDVWQLEDAIPFSNAKGLNSALLVTTRDSSIASAVAGSPNSIFALPVLTIESSLELLRALAPSVVNKHSNECLELARELECLPLALHVAGRLLNDEERMGWGVSDLLTEIREGTRLLNSAVPGDRFDLEGQALPSVSALLRRSTDKLDAGMRSRFAYLSVFPQRPSSFDLDAMGAVWQVEDARPFARILVERGLIEPIGDGRFQIHALLRLLAESLFKDYKRDLLHSSSAEGGNS